MKFEWIYDEGVDTKLADNISANPSALHPWLDLFSMVGIPELTDIYRLFLEHRIIGGIHMVGQVVIFQIMIDIQHAIP